MTATKIEWSDEVWNPVTGCDRVSPGCDNCYALTMSARLKAMGQPKYQTDGRAETSGPGFGVQTHPDVLDQPLRWRKPRRVFVNSMSDLFHPQVPDEFIRAVWDVMESTPQHTYQILTKRPARMRSLCGAGWVKPFCPCDAGRPQDCKPEREGGAHRPPLQWRPHLTPLAASPLPNVWLGISVEDQERADQRVPLLLDTPAAVRFVSAEPLLGPVRLDEIRGSNGLDYMPLTGTVAPEPRIHWVIVGGESGPGARQMHPAWARQLVRQCQQADVAVFVKQLGSHFGRDHHDIDAFPPDLQVREWPDQAVQP